MEQQQKQYIQCQLCKEHIPFVNLPIHKVKCAMKKQSNQASKISKLTTSKERKPLKSRIFRKIQQIEMEQKIPCSFCGYLQTFQELDTHPNKCVGVNLACQYCGDCFPSQLMEEHEQVCPAKDQEQNDISEDQSQESYINQVQQTSLERLRIFMDLINNLILGQIQEHSQGLNLQKISQLKKFKYKSKQQEQLCTICYCKFQMQQECLELKCKHFYHDLCIQKWLEKSSKCPLCKSDQNIIQ